ncbi:MAG: hypothetical protein J6M55_01165 [Paludibacteraceae bacterium]|nr:hypothetical protein [Paludibacteraceae bacterium]
MEEQIIRKLNLYYYGVMILSLIALTAMYYAFSHGLYEPLDRFSQLGMAVQYIVIFDALITIPLGLYLVKWRKPEKPEQYGKIAAWRILLVSNAMPLGIIAFYWMGGYRSMLWVAAVAAVAWYFTKPTLAKMEQEMKPADPNEETY